MQTRSKAKAMTSNETRESPWSRNRLSNVEGEGQLPTRVPTYPYRFQVNIKNGTVPLARAAAIKFLQDHEISKNSQKFLNQHITSQNMDVNFASSRTDQDESVSLSREEIDAKLDRTDARLEATESRMEARLEAALSEIRLSNANVQQSIATLTTEIQTEFRSVPRTSSMVITAATSAIAIIGIILAVLAFGGDRFDGGVQMSTASVEQAIEAKKLGEKNESQLEALNKAVLSLVSEVRALAERSSSP